MHWLFGDNTILVWFTTGTYKDQELENCMSYILHAKLLHLRVFTQLIHMLLCINTIYIYIAAGSRVSTGKHWLHACHCFVDGSGVGLVLISNGEILNWVSRSVQLATHNI